MLEYNVAGSQDYQSGNFYQFPPGWEKDIAVLKNRDFFPKFSLFENFSTFASKIYPTSQTYFSTGPKLLDALKNFASILCSITKIHHNPPNLFAIFRANPPTLCKIKNLNCSATAETIGSAALRHSLTTENASQLGGKPVGAWGAWLVRSVGILMMDAR